MQYILLVLGIVMLLVALVLLLRPWRVTAALPAYLGLLALHFSYFIAVRPAYLWFWGVAAVIVAITAWYSPQGEPDGNRASNLYVGLSALAGALLGLIISPRVMVLAIILACFVGMMAYSRTPQGGWLRRDHRAMVNYFAVKCLPAIVAASIVGIAIEGFIIS